MSHTVGRWGMESDRVGWGGTATRESRLTRPLMTDHPSPDDRLTRPLMTDSPVP